MDKRNFNKAAVMEENINYMLGLFFGSEEECLFRVIIVGNMASVELWALVIANV